MGLILGYVLGRRRERPDAEWADQLGAHADELRGLVDALREDVAVLERAVVAGRAVVPVLRAQNDQERADVNDFLDALSAAEDELGEDET